MPFCVSVRMEQVALRSDRDHPADRGPKVHRRGGPNNAVATDVQKHLLWNWGAPDTDPLPAELPFPAYRSTASLFFDSGSTCLLPVLKSDSVAAWISSILKTRSRYK